MEPPTRKPERELLSLTLVILALIGTSLWSYGQLSSAHSRAALEGDTRSSCESLANQIQSLRDEPTKADDHAMLKADMTRLIAAAASTASLSEKKLVSIDHQNARRIGHTPYLEKPTRVTLRDVQMPQVLSMLYSLTQDNFRLNVSRLRLTAPRDETNTTTWSADTTVTYLIYDPVESNDS